MRNNTTIWDGINRTAHVLHLTADKDYRGADIPSTLCGKTIPVVSGSIIYVGSTHELQWWSYNLCKDCLSSDEYALFQLANCGE